MKHYGSYFTNEQECIGALIQIHNSGNDIDCDPMYFKGNFWKDGLNKPKYRFDLNPQEGVDCEQADATKLPLQNNSLRSIILDPPFLFGVHGQTTNYYSSKTHTIFKDFGELETCYKGILREAYRVLQKGGKLIFKCQDYTDSKTTMCAANDRLKMRPIRELKKSIGKHEQIIGIAADEPSRLTRLKPDCRSVLVEYGIKEADTFEICKRYGLLSPIYEMRSRGGCWFCPNCPIAEFAALKKEYPKLWAELEILSHDTEIASRYFRYDRTFDSVNREIDLINNQINIFDILGSNQ